MDESDRTGGRTEKGARTQDDRQRRCYGIHNDHRGFLAEKTISFLFKTTCSFFVTSFPFIELKE